MTSPAQRVELKAFLRARRSALKPEAVGLTRGTRRLTPGLRREEVAMLAGVGVTWYTWLEQGREINVSAAALQRIAQALTLSPTDASYLFSLAGLARTELPVEPVEIPAPIRGVLDLFQGPAFVLDPIFDVLAYNALADYLFAFDRCRGPFARNHVWNAFMNPARRKLYPDFTRSALNLLGILRMSHATHPDPRFDPLVEALCGASAEFASLWRQQQTAPLSALHLPLWHEELGELCVYSTRLPVGDRGADGATVFFFVPADEATTAAFAGLAERLRERGRRAPA